MFERLIEWFRGNNTVEFWGEKQTPETNESEPLPQESNYERELRLIKDKMVESNKELERQRLIEKENLEIEKIKLQKVVDELILNESEFEIGQQVEYIKIPNNSVKFYVTSYSHTKVVEDWCRRWYVYISDGNVTVQYFDANQILQTINDEIKWFKKV